MDATKETDRQWAIRDMPFSERQMAKDAAKRAGVPVPLWLAQAIRAHVSAEREDGLPSNTIAPVSLDDIMRAVEILRELTHINGVAPSPHALNKLARQTFARLGIDIRGVFARPAPEPVMIEGSMH